jgi:hypothetical protein
MSPLALIPIGLYALIATVGAESLVDNQAETPIENDQAVTLKESIMPSKIPVSVKSKWPSTPALTSSAGLTDPVVKTAIIKAFEKQAEKNRPQLVQTAAAASNPKVSEEDPGQYFSKTETDDDGGYSAPLGLKNESHNDWMK